MLMTSNLHTVKLMTHLCGLAYVFLLGFYNTLTELFFIIRKSCTAARFMPLSNQLIMWRQQHNGEKNRAVTG